MCDYLPEGCYDSYFDTDDELAPNQQYEYDFLTEWSEKLKPIIAEMEKEKPISLGDIDDLMMTLAYLSKNSNEIYDFLSEAEIEREPED